MYYGVGISLPNSNTAAAASTVIWVQLQTYYISRIQGQLIGIGVIHIKVIMI